MDRERGRRRARVKDGDGGGSSVATLATLARWKVDDPRQQWGRKSDAFKMGTGKWFLTLEKHNRMHDRVMLSSESSSPPVDGAKVELRFQVPGSKFRALTLMPVQDLGDGTTTISWLFRRFQTPVVFILEFLELNLRPWDLIEGPAKILSGRKVVSSFQVMLQKRLFSEVTIILPDGQLRAHEAVLTARSPVFRAMFSYNLKEKQTSTIEMNDVTLEACTAFLHFICDYCVGHQEFVHHRSALIGLANKYDVPDLLEMCELSMVEDLDVGNVLERLEEAWLYRLEKLKNACWEYLFLFGKIEDVDQEEIDGLVRHGDRDLAALLLNKFLSYHKTTVLP